jgi:type IV pilus assembly protein PilO
MPRTFKLGDVKLAGAALRDPRVAMRVVIGALLVANLAAAIMAFKPFGGSADDLRREQADLRRRIAQLEQRAKSSRALVDNIDTARREGGEFLAQYVLDAKNAASTLAEELDKVAKEAGLRPQPSQQSPEPVEGSETLFRVSISAGYDGSYAALRKFVELLDKSPRFLVIIENLNVVAPQQQQQQQTGQTVNVTVKLDAWVRATPGAQS